MKRKKKYTWQSKWKHRLEYYAIRLLAAILKKIPREMALQAGGRLGILAGLVLRKRYRIAEENMALAFPQWPLHKVKTLTWANFQHIGICGVETLLLDQLRCCEEDVKRYYQCVGFENFDRPLELGRGAILLTGHLGFWECGNYILAANGYAAAAVTKPLKNPLADVYFTNIRESFGSQTIDSRKGARKILKALQQQKIVGILLDQHIAPPGAVPTRFFGRLAYTTTAITNLAMKYQIPVVPTFCLRQPDGRYRVEALPMIMLEGEGEAALERNTQMLTDLIEAAVRKDPSQWFWMHERWKAEKPKWVAKRKAEEGKKVE
ncbi:KDO2-lipid IV(A) lauroyltransferase [Malonomonas rubra DSM 5091]|uniref:KDO2-lipid IV(A) lauroyltransferase n=1 Tax=Malonomonas rubra DSM 5091 TaxID=1122189 RepID=A0A1M6F5Q6_MALRU|nr:lysophospholipid acyltransferase family protein [Malonomonas rubra]SHI93011.1 KDO2-lipid IV(A) lauroyltransferase [Malonomonas rubra DSM 5091]